MRGAIIVVLLGCGDGTSMTSPEGGVPDGTVVMNPDGNMVVPDGGNNPDSPAGNDSGPANGKSPVIAGCDIFPPDNPWNRDVSMDALRGDSAMFIQNMAPGTGMHADWGTFSQQYGIPVNTGTNAPAVKMTWTTSWGPKESDILKCANPNDGNFCYPIPSTVKIEGGPNASMGSDRHVLFLDTAGAPPNCTLYETYNTQNWVGPGWTAANGAIFHLNSNALRTLGWTSADAAGLSVLAGLVRYDEVMAGEIRHAIRFTMSSTQQAYIKPATHAAGAMNASLPPMGLRLRLKSSVTVNGASAPAQTIITALKKYGLMLADNGSNWYITGDTADGWGPLLGGINTALGQIHGSDFEVVDTGPIITTGL